MVTHKHNQNRIVGNVIIVFVRNEKPCSLDVAIVTVGSLNKR